MSEQSVLARRRCASSSWRRRARVESASTSGTLAEQLADAGVKVTVCAPRSSITALRLDELDRGRDGSDRRVRVIQAPVGALDPRSLRATRRILRAAVSAGSIGVVHAHGLRAGAACAAFLPAAPLAVTWHNAPLGGRAQQLAHQALARFVARRADLTLAASDDLAAGARAAGARMVRSAFVAAPTLPAPQRDVELIRAELNVGERPLVLAIGRLHPQKRLDVLVAAAAPWVTDVQGPIVVIAGEGPSRAELEAQIAATGAAVQLLGARDDVSDLLAAADVVALPSEWEARALVAQEALRAGVPLVTTAVGGLPSLVGDAAVLVPVGDAAALRHAIVDLLANPRKRADLIHRGLRQAESWPDHAENIDELIAIYLDLNSKVRAK